MTDPVEKIVGMSGNRIITNSVGLLYDTSLYIGWSGWSGLSGLSGYVGLVGTIGWSGQSGMSGWSGLTGFSGLGGWTGWSGWSGTPQWCPPSIASYYLYADYQAFYGGAVEWIQWCDISAYMQHWSWYDEYVKTETYGGKTYLSIMAQLLAVSAPVGWANPLQGYVENPAAGRTYCTNDDRFFIAILESSPTWGFSGVMGLKVFHKGQGMWSSVAPNPFHPTWWDPDGDQASISKAFFTPRGRQLLSDVWPTQPGTGWNPQRGHWSCGGL